MVTQNASQSDDRIEKLITVLGQRMNALTQTLQMIAESLQGVELNLREMSISSNPAPNYRRPLSDYQDFDWGVIGAIIIKEDEDGATEVEWNGQVFTRRSAENHFDAAVWYSRCVGKDSDGKNKYLRLITFKPPTESGPIGAKAKKAIGSKAP
jgi:ssDNA-binding DdrB-like protein